MSPRPPRFQDDDTSPCEIAFLDKIQYKMIAPVAVSKIQKIISQNLQDDDTSPTN